ncbi:hypothetical protein GGF37_004344, partial [Kickxella alabastrina]
MPTPAPASAPRPQSLLRRRRKGAPSIATQASSSEHSLGQAPDAHPLDRLRQLQRLASSAWEPLGTVALPNTTASVARASPDASAPFVLRASATLDGWTVFDALGAILHAAPAQPWTGAQMLEHPDGQPMRALLRYSAAGSWATQRRHAHVLSAWATDGRRRIEIAEASVAPVAPVAAAAAGPEAGSVCVDVLVAGWVLEATAAEQAGAEAHRRPQHAVRVTRFLQANPRGWLDAADNALARLAAAQAARDWAARAISQLSAHLRVSGAAPLVVWTRNAYALGAQRFRARSVEPGDACEIELRVEHTVWGAAHAIALRVSPWTADGCAAACFVDPDIDPHAVRIRLRLGARVMAPVERRWPVACATVERREGGPRAALSLPPRIEINGVQARVRFLRRATDPALYGRCQSVAAQDAGAMECAAGEFVEAASGALKGAGPQSGGLPAPLGGAVAVAGHSAAGGRGAAAMAVSPDRFADLAQRTFADLRHAAAADPTRRRWEAQRNPGRADQARLPIALHPEIPVTLASAVLPATAAAHAIQALLRCLGDSAAGGCPLFLGRRTLQAVSAGTTIEHARLHVPLLCAARDALSVRRISVSPSVPTRRRLSAWAHGSSASSRGRREYLDPGLTLVEASVPDSQPRHSAVRAQLLLFGIRVEPVDPFERVASGDRRLQHPACRLTVACCVDYAGSLPLLVRRSLSESVPGDVVAWVRQALGMQVQRPFLLAPLPASVRKLPRGGHSGAWVVRETVEAAVDGSLRRFVRLLDAPVQSIGVPAADALRFSACVCLPKAQGFSPSPGSTRDGGGGEGATLIVADIHVPPSLTRISARLSWSVPSEPGEAEDAEGALEPI